MAAEFAKLLEQVDSTQQTIQSTAKYFTDMAEAHNPDLRELVSVWSTQFDKTDKKLELFYVANEILHCNAVGNDLKKYFAACLPRAITLFANNRHELH
jgi:hypothetical protein